MRSQSQAAAHLFASCKASVCLPDACPPLRCAGRSAVVLQWLKALNIIRVLLIMLIVKDSAPGAGAG